MKIEIPDRTLTFEQAIAAVAAERAHQERKYGRIEDRHESLGHYLIIVKKELVEAEDGLCKQLPGRHSSLAELVQVAAAAIAAIEKYGAQGNADGRPLDRQAN